MSYFKRFPFVKDYSIQSKTFTGQDITRRTGLDKASKENRSVYQEYEIKEGESPHMLADRIYDNADLYWVLLVFNDRFDEIEDWPLDQYSLDTFIKRKYPNPYGIHHWKAISTGAQVTEDYPEYDRIPITNYEYEIEVNESKRKIKVPLPNYVTAIVNEHNRLISL